ncbi:hypothetical protein FGO68_gene5641 [Halteria grandinella]|uniref:Uncharacterized protein n=1 Tax=Halteria grandinella TaxID=5974 RepID=A0A8J8NP42_HALGN|nr:hypothetical protein FGO68_gene5641 [Halteria grandinella]
MQANNTPTLLPFAVKLGHLYGWKCEEASSKKEEQYPIQANEAKEESKSSRSEQESVFEESVIPQDTQTKVSTSEKYVNPKKRKLEDFKQPAFIMPSSTSVQEEVTTDANSSQTKRMRENPRSPASLEHSVSSNRILHEESREQILLGLMTKFFKVNDRYILRQYTEKSFSIKRFGQQKATLNYMCLMLKDINL